MVTIKDIAHKLGIASSSVSKGLNGASDISADLRQQIFNTAVELGYTTKKMKKESNKKLAVFIENMDYESNSQFGYEIILGFKQLAFRDNYSVTVVPVNSTLQSAQSYDTYMLKHGYTGAFLVGFALQDDWIKQLESTSVPTVLFDNSIAKNPKVGYIGTDSFEGIYLAIEHLYHLGHTKIAFLNGSPNSMISVHRNQAFLDAMSAFRLPIGKNLIQYGYYVSDCAKYHVPDFLSEGATAIVCASDLIASGVIIECKSRGFKIPKDISIVGFDDMPISAHLNPPLTTIRQDRTALGKCAYYSLASMIMDIPISKTLLRPQLIIRSSTGLCPADV